MGDFFTHISLSLKGVIYMYKSSNICSAALLFWYEQGNTWAQVDKLLGITSSARFRKKHNIQTRSRSEINKLVHQHMSDEVKQRRHDKMSQNSWAKNHSQEEEQQRVEKWRKTYLKNYDKNVEKNREVQLKRFANVDKREEFKQKQRITKSITGNLNPIWLKDLTHEQRTQMAHKAIRTKKQHGTFNVPHSDSNINQQFANLLDKHNIKYQREFFINSYEYVYDFKVNNTLIELNPTYTHNSTYGCYSTAPKDKYYHYNKSLAATKLGYRCVHIFDWDNIEKIIFSLQEKNILYARKCDLKEVSVQDTNDFLNTYHFQGTCKGQLIRLGLYYNDTLVSLMTFGKPRYNKNYEWELLRYCSINKVVGGANKLFKHFIKIYNPQSIISYCDNSKFIGQLYIDLGFKLSKAKVKPSKHWYNEKLKVHITDNLLRQRGFDQLFGTHYGKGTSNEQLMLDSGFVEIYDCGQSKYVWKSNT